MLTLLSRKFPALFQSLKFLPLVLTSSLLGISSSPAADWPHWLGPDHNGVYSEEGIIESIPETGLPVLWRTPVGGGYSGPAVVGDQVFVMDYQKQGGEAFNDPGRRAQLTGKERVLCLDRNTGKVIWEHAYERPYSISYPSGPRCTPTVDEDLVFTLGSEGDLHCLNKSNGELIWSHNFPNDFSAEVPIWGFASHPLVDGDLLICLVGGAGQTVVAFDKRTGEVVWKALSASAIGYCPASIIEAGGKRQLLIWHADGLYSLDPASGQTYWNVEIKPSYAMAVTQPQKDGNHLYVSGIHSESVMLELGEDAPTVKELWRGKRNQAVYCCNSTPIFHNGTIFGADCNVGALIAVNGKTGDRYWQTFAATKPDEKRFVKHGNAFITRLAGTDSYLLLSEVGDLILADLSAEEYKERGRFHVLEPTSEAFGRRVLWSHPAYAGQTAFVRNDKEIVAVDISKP